jgi:hypothetical protein
MTPLVLMTFWGFVAFLLAGIPILVLAAFRVFFNQNYKLNNFIDRWAFLILVAMTALGFAIILLTLEQKH